MIHEEIKNKIKSFWTDEKLGQEFEEKCDDHCTYGEDYGEDLEYESAYEYYIDHAMGGAVEYDLMEDMERWARENGIDCDEETLSDVTREIITEQPWCDSFVFRGRSSNSDYDKLKSSFDNLFDNKNNKYEMKHLKTFKQINEGKSPKKITKEEYNILCMIGDMQHDGDEGVSSESFDKSEYKVVKELEKDGLVELNDEDLYILTSDGKKLMKDEHIWDAGEQGPGKQLNKKEIKRINKKFKKK